MFDQLVVSARQRHKHTTAKFFFGTSVLYILVIALAFGVSVLVSDPKLADTGNILTLVASLPPAAGTPPKLGGPQSPPKPAPRRPDPNNVMSLEDLMAQPKGAPPPTPISDRWGTEIGTGPSSGPPGVGSPIGVEGGAPIIDAPPKPEPANPKPPVPTPTTTTVENRPMRVSSTVLQGKAIERRTPPYPELARQIRLPGEVSVEVIISPEGRVESTRAVSGQALFVKAALDAARGWRFEPTLLNGVPVRVTGVITFVFKLNE